MKKIFCILLSVISTALFSFASSPIKIVYIATQAGSPRDCAVFNGAREAFKELGARYGKTFELELMSSRDADDQLKKLGRAYINGNKGALLTPIKSLENRAKEIADFTQKNFPIALVGEDIPDSKRLCYVGGDESKLRQMAKAEFKRLANNAKMSVFVYSKGDESSSKFVLKRCNELFGKDLLDSVSNGNLRIEFTPLYSLYASMNSTEITRRDNYAEIFIDVELFSDTTAITRDMDRAFSICIGAAPYLARYLESGELSACLYHDYFGWGYFAARALAEKIMDGASPSSPVRELPPLLATPDTAKSFKVDWSAWIK